MENKATLSHESTDAGVLFIRSEKNWVSVSEQLMSADELREWRTFEFQGKTVERISVKEMESLIAQAAQEDEEIVVYLAALGNRCIGFDLYFAHWAEAVVYAENAIRQALHGR